MATATNGQKHLQLMPLWETTAQYTFDKARSSYHCLHKPKLTKHQATKHWHTITGVLPLLLPCGSSNHRHNIFGLPYESLNPSAAAFMMAAVSRCRYRRQGRRLPPSVPSRCFLWALGTWRIAFDYFYIPCSAPLRTHFCAPHRHFLLRFGQTTPPCIEAYHRER